MELGESADVAGSRCAESAGVSFVLLKRGRTELVQRGVPTFPSTAEVRAFSEGYTPQSAPQGPRARRGAVGGGAGGGGVQRGRNSQLALQDAETWGRRGLETEDPLARSESRTRGNSERAAIVTIGSGGEGGDSSHLKWPVKSSEAESA